MYTNNLLRQLDDGWLNCDDCNQQVRGETVKQHCRAKGHIRAKAKRFAISKLKSQGKQSSIRTTIADSAASATDPELQGHRFVFVACALKSGTTSLSQIDDLRPAIDRDSKFKLTAAPNLRKLLPAINNWEKSNVATIVQGKEFAWFHDSATRCNELLAVTMRVLDVDTETGRVFCRMVLIRLKFLSASSNQHTLAADQHAALQDMGLTKQRRARQLRRLPDERGRREGPGVPVRVHPVCAVHVPSRGQHRREALCARGGQVLHRLHCRHESLEGAAEGVGSDDWPAVGGARRRPLVQPG